MRRVFAGLAIGPVNWINLGQIAERGRVDRGHRARDQAINDICVYLWSAMFVNYYAAIWRGKQIRFLLTSRLAGSQSHTAKRPSTSFYALGALFAHATICIE
jgi:hypothetical protein